MLKQAYCTHTQIWGVQQMVSRDGENRAHSSSHHHKQKFTEIMYFLKSRRARLSLQQKLERNCTCLVFFSDTVHFFIEINSQWKKGLGDYRAATLVSKTEGVRSSVQPRSVRSGGARSKTEAVMPCQSNWVAQQPARVKRSVHGGR